MKYQLILLSVLALTFFQCTNAPASSPETATETAANSTPVAPSATTMPAASPNETSPTVNTETQTDPAPTTAPVYDPSKVKSAVTDVQLGATSKVRPAPTNDDRPTVTSIPPPPVVEEEKPTEGVVVTEMPVVIEEAPAPEKPVQAPAHSRFDDILRATVSASGKVNYGAVKGKMAELDAYLYDTEINAPTADWTKARAMAYWINVYNANTLKLVADSYPISSIKDLHGGSPWDVKFIRIGKNNYSLNQIENDFLRARYGDARIHFAVNCAAKSCPPLHNRAFTEENLNSKLQQLTRSFLNNENYNTISENELKVSQIFDWYAKDFGTLTAFIDRYTKTDISSDAEVTYKEYDWSLNN